jgi:hypothetical protein
MRQVPRQALRRGRCAVLWQNTVIGTGEVRYFVEGLGPQRSASSDFGRLLDAEEYYDRIVDDRPKRDRPL